MSSERTGCILLRDYENLEKAGSGCFGLVLKAKKKGENFYSAIKVIHNDPTTGRTTLDEAEKLSRVSNHDSIVSCVEHWKDEFTKDEHDLFVRLVKPKKTEPFHYFPVGSRSLKVICIRMEYCENGTLKQWLKGRGSEINVWENVQVFLQLVRGVEHLHAHNLIHRDVKPDNILFHKKNAKIGDLGYSATHNTGDYLHTPQAGAALYRSPEQSYGVYGKSADYYALGLILFELFHPEAQKNVGQALTKLKFNRQIPTELRLSQPIITYLIGKLISVEPEKRPNSDEIVSKLRPLLEALKPSPERGQLRRIGKSAGCQHYERKCKVKVQQFPRRTCLVCKVIFAKYFCSTCNLFDDGEDATLIYHCHLCGICRKKTHENVRYKHCDCCGMCYPYAIKTEDGRLIGGAFLKHECKEDAGKMPCSVCHKAVHDSREPAVLAKCQHYVHKSCRDLFPE
ncbi:Interferon-induced, double-stranded RNA-activated protein kinase, partial [Pseudolycoriella hygida]